MKKIGIIFLSVLILLINLAVVGCKEEEFKAFRTITLVTNGETKKISSYKSGKFVFQKEITEEEYKKNRHKYTSLFFDSPATFYKEDLPTFYKIPEEHKEKTCYTVPVENPDQEYIVIDYFWDKPIYRVYKQDKEETYWIGQVNVVDSETLIIDLAGKETTYKVTSFSVNYF